MTQLVLILGMHRSGSSFVTQLLNKFGVELSQGLIEENKDNPDGFFEDSYIVSQNKLIEEIVNRSHARPSGILSTPTDWQQNQQLQDIKQNLATYITDNLTQSNTENWGFKDPRTMRWLQLYTEIFAEENIQPHIILCLREPSSIVRSLSQRNQLTRKVVELILLRHYFELIKNIKDHTITVIEYEKVFENSSVILNQLAEIFNYQGDIQLIDSFVSQCNSKYRPLKKLNEDKQKFKCSELISDVHGYLLMTENTTKAKNEIEKKLNFVFEATSGYEDYLGSIREISDKLYLSGRENGTLERRLLQLTETNNEIRKHRGEVKLQLSQTKRELSEINNQLSQTKRELSEINNQLSQTKTKLTQTKNKLTQTKNKLTQTKNRLTKTQNSRLFRYRRKLKQLTGI